MRVDFGQLHGIEQVKRAIEIAWAGYHDLIIMSKPGYGNSYLWQALFQLTQTLTQIDESEAIYMNRNDREGWFQYERKRLRDEFDKLGLPIKAETIIVSKETDIPDPRCMVISMPKIRFEDYWNIDLGETTIMMAERIINARIYQFRVDARRPENAGYEGTRDLLKHAAQKLDWTVQQIALANSIAGTIALLDQLNSTRKIVKAEHVAEAVQYLSWEKEKPF